MRKTLLVLPGYCVGLGGLLLITYQTLLAVGSENKAITIQVNRFGGQYVDILCLVFLWAVCVIGMWSLSLVVREKTAQTADHDDGKKYRASTPMISFEGESQSFFDEASGALVQQGEAPFSMKSSVFFSVDDGGKNNGCSFSVRIVSDDAEEENRY
jgi:hypothetical protein